jgi:Transposase DDE domain
MDAFERELMRRSPLAACVLDVCDHIFDDQLLDKIWGEHRGRCYEDVLRFEGQLRLMRDALIRHGGSAHKLFVELESRGAQPIDESNFYRKLSRTPVQLSRALLRECTQKLAALMPGPVVTLPACFDGFDVIVGDGKKIKNATKRLMPTRGYEGSLIGAKALVALDVRSGLVLAMNDSLDGMTNDVPLVPGLMEQLWQIIPRHILSIWDRQFDDVRTLTRLSAREGDSFLVRMKQFQTPFAVESSVQSTDAQGRQVLDEIGLLGKGKTAMRVRRITLVRTGEGEDDVVLLSDLLERAQCLAADLLELYRHRWGIEQVFQQVTETFSLTHLIGCAPKAVLLQFGFCLLLYNLMQMIKAYVAEDGGVLASIVSMYYLFDDVRKELEAWAYHTDGSWPRMPRDAEQMRRWLRQLLEGSWDPVAYTKAADKKRRPPRPPGLRLHGGHSSVQRALEGTAKVVTA